MTAERTLFLGFLGALALAAVAFLSACSDDADRTPRMPVPAASVMDPSRWDIGPTIDGRNYSQNLARVPAAEADGFSIPLGPDVEPHYVTFRHGSLRGKSVVSMRFSVELAEGAVIHGKGCPTDSPGHVSLYFQRAGDDWRTDGSRWWSTFATVVPLVPGVHEITAPLSGRWTSVEDMNAVDHAAAFERAKAEADRVGFTFGNCTGYGHGIRATGPGRFKVLEFRVE